MAGSDFKFDGLDELEQKLTVLIEKDFPEEFKKMVIQVAWELQGRVKENTPIGPTGHLADGWEVGEIKKQGHDYVIEVYSNVEYVGYVNDGHRTRVNKKTGKRKGFVPGKHMMEISLQEVRDALPEYLKDWLDDFLRTHEL